MIVAKVNFNLFSINIFRIKPDFVSTRGEFSRLLATKGKLQNGWIMYAGKWKRTIYLEADRGKTYDVVFPDSTKYPSRGYKFEKYIVSGTYTELCICE